ncbi:MAG: glycosyltransferase family 2 protein [Lachnospiraceae bacterium]|nr:glycosyltransferase family 2 protein [Lachnospiraceae bacterium]
MERSYVVTLTRFHRKEENKYIVQGYFQGNSIAGSRMSVYLDAAELPVEIVLREGLAIRQKYFARGVGYENIDREYDLIVTLPEDLSGAKRLKVIQEADGVRACVFRTSVRRMLKEKKRPDCYLETFHDQDGRVAIGGWAVGYGPCRIQVKAGKEKLKCDLKRVYRQDIADNFPELKEQASPEELRFGFEVAFDRPQTSRVSLIVGSDGQRECFKIDLRRGLKGLGGHGSSPMTRVLAYLKRNGLRRTVRRVQEKLREKMTGQQESYMQWRKRHQPSKEELQAQSRNVFLHQPLISVVVPLYKTPEHFLRQLVESLQAQTYSNWELCLSDGSGEDSPLTGLLKQLQEDKRIQVVSSPVPLGISENTNAALDIARGDYIVFADHDDLLPAWAMYELVHTINENPEADLIYSDEDKVSFDGKEYFEPHFKSDFNIDLLCSMNYFCHLVCVSRALYEKTGQLDPAYNGAQDYDFVLRAAEQAKCICHIPKVLYHWRSHKDSTAENPASKMYAFEAGQRAVQAHYDRIGVEADVLMGQYPGLYRTVYRMPENPPLISIIIPNKDHVSDLDKCVRTILKKATYPNYEFVVVENNSTNPATFEYYREMEQKYSNFHVAYWDREFNYSLINNFGAEHAKGEYFLLLNNDTQIINEDCLEEMLGPCLRPEVGIVGARLYFEDDTIQHAGVILGYGGIAGHAFSGMPRTANGYFSRILCQSDLSAVTAAALMVKRSVFEEVGGLEEALKVAFNDVDFCLKVRKAGKLVVYNPFAQMYHFESKSRGAEDTPDKIARFNSEADLFIKRWPQILENGDPYYNPNLTLDRDDFSLKK